MFKVTRSQADQPVLPLNEAVDRLQPPPEPEKVDKKFSWSGFIGNIALIIGVFMFGGIIAIAVLAFYGYAEEKKLMNRYCENPQNQQDITTCEELLVKFYGKKDPKTEGLVANEEDFIPPDIEDGFGGLIVYEKAPENDIISIQQLVIPETRRERHRSYYMATRTVLSTTAATGEATTTSAPFAATTFVQKFFTNTTNNTTVLL